MFYTVEIIEQKMHTITVEAEDKTEAEELAWEELVNGEDVETEELPAFVSMVELEHA